MRLSGAFTDLLILLLSAASAVNVSTVPPPTNVSVVCTNLQTTVSWTYDDKRPQTRFRVIIKGSNGPYENETSEHQYDLTSYVWQSDRHYMDFMYVTVAAMQGGEQSQPVDTPTFTYNGLRKAHVTCSLDFPPVNMVAEEAAIAITFPNPFHFYTELKTAERHRDSFFKFVSEQGNFTSVCKPTQIICRYDLEASDDAEMCVTLKGWLDYGNNVEHVPFKETGRICPEPGGGDHVTVTVVLLIALVLVIGGVSISICAVKAWTLKPVLKPTVPPLVLPNPDRHFNYFPVTADEIHPVTVVVQASRSPSVCSEGGHSQGGAGGGRGKVGGDEEGSGDASGGGGDGVDLRQHELESCYTDGKLLEDSSQDLEAVGLMSTGHGTDEDSADDSVKTECSCIEDEEPNTEPLLDDSRRHYDRPHTS